MSACSASAEVAARFIVCNHSPKARFSYLLMNYPLERCNRWVLLGFVVIDAISGGEVFLRFFQCLLGLA